MKQCGRGKISYEALYLLYLTVFPAPHVSFEQWQEWKHKSEEEKGNEQNNF